MANHRPLEQLLDDVKKIDETIKNAQMKRSETIRQIKALGEAATQYAENLSNAG